VESARETWGGKVVTRSGSARHPKAQQWPFRFSPARVVAGMGAYTTSASTGCPGPDGFGNGPPGLRTELAPAEAVTRRRRGSDPAPSPSGTRDCTAASRAAPPIANKRPWGNPLQQHADRTGPVTPSWRRRIQPPAGVRCTAPAGLRSLLPPIQLAERFRLPGRAPLRPCPAARPPKCVGRLRSGLAYRGAHPVWPTTSESLPPDPSRCLSALTAFHPASPRQRRRA